MEIRSAATRVARWAGFASGDPVPDAPVRWVHAARAFLLVVPAYVLLFATLFGRTGVTIGAPVAVTSIIGALSRPGRPDVRRHAKAAIAAGSSSGSGCRCP